MNRLFLFGITLVIIVSSSVFAGIGQVCVLNIFPKNEVLQGDSVIISVKASSVIKSSNLKIKVFDKAYNLYAVSAKEYRLPLGISMEQKPGAYKVMLLNGDKQNAAGFLSVKKKPFRRSKIYLTKQTKSLVTSPDLDKEANIIGYLFRMIKSLNYFGKNKFIKPISGQISSEFGVGRNYIGPKGEIVSTWSHRGVDFAGKMGEKVLAINSGKVILANQLKVHGGTIMLDHGQGIISIYAHVDKVLVKKGDLVKQGQQIATVGITGISTGPHVHLGLSVSNVRVNPLQWMSLKMI